jgi:hypothetical protein
LIAIDDRFGWLKETEALAPILKLVQFKLKESVAWSITIAAPTVVMTAEPD